MRPSIIKVTDFDGMGHEKPQEKEDTDELEMEYLAARIKKYYNSWGQTAVIVDKIEKARKLKEFLTKMDVQNIFILTKDEDELKDFKDCKDENKILVGVNMLNEGIDIPKLNTIYLYAPTRSQVVLRQRVGRVLRNSKSGEKKARIIWQHYPKNVALTKDAIEKLLGSDFEELEETQQDLKEDKEEWEKDKSLPIPPAMYLEPLPEDGLLKKDYYSEWQRLEILELFSAEELNEAESIGFYYDTETFERTGCAIYVRDVERKGYRQFLRVLQNDWQSVLRYHNCENFEQYAKALNVSEAELLDDIKKICFYMSDVRKADKSGRKPKERFHVREEDIKTFCSWCLTGEISYRSLGVNYRNGKAENQAGIKKLDKKEEDKSEIRYFADQEGMKRLKEEIERKTSACKVSNKGEKKRYTDLLTYCEGKYIYPELMSMKSLLRMGVCDSSKRIKDPLELKGKEWAFVGREKNGDLKEVKHVFRKTRRKFTKEDWLLMASTLVEMPDHIWVTQRDVDEYEAKLLERLKKIGGLSDNNLGQEQLAKEFLMALGYCSSDNILRKQCGIFEKDLPRLIKYMLYEKAYKYLATEVKPQYGSENGHVGCQNESELENEYNSFLQKYSVCKESMGDMSPVKEVIYDYRPYLKAVPYYQGIKPEFLCRMANSIVEMRRDAKDTECVVDAFGGSGAYTMNAYYQGIGNYPTQVYNDLGIMNVAFYQCLQDEKKLNSLEEKVDKIIASAFSTNKEDDTMGWFFGKFLKYLGNKKVSEDRNKQIVAVKEILERPVKECEDCYVEAYNKKVKEYRVKNQGVDSNKAMRFEDRMDEIHGIFNNNIGGDFDVRVFQNVERYMHVFMLKMKALYLTLTGEKDMEVVKNQGINDVDLAVLFLMYNSLPQRHFYNHCTIDKIAEFMRSYKERLKYGAEIFKDVEVRQEDAINLLKRGNYNKKGTVWYLDIPYTETDSANYVPDGFNMDRFIESLSGCEGTYIVSSRCNVCLPEEVKEAYSRCYFKEAVADEGIMVKDGADELPKPVRKELNVFAFFNSFVSKGDAADYEKYIIKIRDDDDKKMPKHISEDKKAKYIFIPYTKMQEDYFKGEDENIGGAQRHSLETNNSKITFAYVRRMLAATHISNIPVEVMITNAEFDFKDMHNVHEVKGEKGLYVMPTFKMGADGSQYMVEPIVIIMQYKKFMEQMLRLLYKNEWRKYLEEKNRLATAKYFYDKFRKK